MAEHPNAAMIRKSIEAMNAKDFTYLDSIMADDIVWHVIGAAEPLRGKEAMSSSMGGDRGFEITVDLHLSLIHISEPTRLKTRSRMPSSA